MTTRSEFGVSPAGSAYVISRQTSRLPVVTSIRMICGTPFVWLTVHIDFPSPLHLMGVSPAANPFAGNGEPPASGYSQNGRPGPLASTSFASDMTLPPRDWTPSGVSGVGPPEVTLWR